MLKKLLSTRFWAKAKNDSGERIESLRFSVPALRVGVLEYGAGQLQTNNAELDGKPVRLYYPPEAVSDEKFLKSLETAPVVVGGHDSTTSEQNKKIDGWAHNVVYDQAGKAAMISGVVKGAKEVAYIKTNLGNAGFGASAFVDIHNLKVENGVTPDGQTYNAIAYDLRATHVALAPNVRDPQNKIKVNNAVVINSNGKMVEEVYNMRKTVEVTYTDGTKHSVEVEGRDEDDILNKYRKGEKVKLYDGGRVSEHTIASAKVKNSYSEEKMEIDSKELAAAVKNAVEEVMKEKTGDDRLSELESAVNLLGEAVKEIKEAMGAEGENCSAKGKNNEGEEEGKEGKKEEKDSATLENAKPSQAMVAAFSTAFNTDFGAKTPSFATLGALAGVKETDPAARIAAVNAKFAEMQKTSPKKDEESFSVGGVF